MKATEMILAYAVVGVLVFIFTFKDVGKNYDKMESSKFVSLGVVETIYLIMAVLVWPIVVSYIIYSLFSKQEKK